MKALFRKVSFYTISIVISLALTACAGDPMESGLDPYAPMVFKEGFTTMPSSPPNPKALISFYVSPRAIFKFAVDADSISIGKDGVTRYVVVMTNTSGEQQAQYEGIRCDSFQWRLYGTFENNAWRENPLSTWRDIQTHIANRYQAALAQGAFCSFTNQVKNITTVQNSLDPKKFTGGTQPSNSFGIIEGY
jgi:CNP1-like family